MMNNVLNKIYLYRFADNNAISNVTEYGSEAYPASQKFLHSQKTLLFTPFAAYPALHTL